MGEERITLLVVTPGGKKAKSLGIKVSHLKIAILTLISFAAISVLSFMLTYKFYSKLRAHSEENKEAVTELVNTISILDHNLNAKEVAKDKLKEELNTKLSTEAKLRDRLGDIEEKLLEMDELLGKKGIKNKLSVGGEFYSSDRLSLPYVDFIEKDIDELFNTMKSLPVGTPLTGRINSGFGQRNDPFNSRLAFHSGVDIDADYGENVVATAEGVVRKSGWYGGYGKAVVITHKDGYETLYGHLSKINVKVGDRIKVGEVIGKAGSTGRASGVHLHYEVMKNGKKTNPKKYLSLK